MREKNEEHESEKEEQEKDEILINDGLILCILGAVFGLIFLQSLPILYGRYLEEGSDVMNFITIMVSIEIVVSALGVIWLALTKMENDKG